MKKNNWFMFVVNGLIAILFGLMIIFIKEETIIKLTLYFGLLILAGGAILLIVAVRNMKQEKPHALLLAESIAAILIGAIIAFYPQQSLKFFLILVGVWAVIIGLMQIIMAVQMKNKVSNHNLFTINGVITLVVGLLLFFDPMGAIKALLIIIGLLALVTGVLLIYLGFQVRSSKKLTQ
jgi:uncharacterized membrane protein HdeD (DUF308 family)